MVATGSSRGNLIQQQKGKNNLKQQRGKNNLKQQRGNLIQQRDNLLQQRGKKIAITKDVGRGCTLKLLLLHQHILLGTSSVFVFVFVFVVVFLFVFVFVFFGANNTNDWLKKKVSAMHITRTIMMYIIRQLDNNGKAMDDGNMIAIVIALTLATAAR